MSEFEVGARVEVRPEFRGAGLRSPLGTVIANPVVRRKSRVSDERKVYHGYVDIRSDAGQVLLGLSYEQIAPERMTSGMCKEADNE